MALILSALVFLPAETLLFYMLRTDHCGFDVSLLPKLRRHNYSMVTR